MQCSVDTVSSHLQTQKSVGMNRAKLPVIAAGMKPGIEKTHAERITGKEDTIAVQLDSVAGITLDSVTAEWAEQQSEYGSAYCQGG